MLVQLTWLDAPQRMRRCQLLSQGWPKPRILKSVLYVDVTADDIHDHQIAEQARHHEIFSLFKSATFEDIVARSQDHVSANTVTY